MKALLFAISIFISFQLNAQSKITKYYDEDWTETPKEKAAFYADFIKEGNNYKCTSYWINTTIIRGRSIYTDTLMQSPTVGLQVLYFKNGQIEDSNFVENGQIKFDYRYYPNKQLASYYYLSEDKKKPIIIGYDEEGNKIKNYIYFKEAEFKGGQKAWEKYISKNASSDIQIKSDSTINAVVEVSFMVDENGDVKMAKIVKSSGIKLVDRDALRVISESPQWNAGILYNKPFKAYRLQHFTYQLKPEKR